MTDRELAALPIHVRNEILDTQDPAEAAEEARYESRVDPAEADPDAWQTGQDRYEAQIWG